MSGHKPIVVVGSINMDVVASTRTLPSPGETVIGDDLRYEPGGKGANQAVAAARLDYPVHLIGCLGNDPFGHQLRTSLNQAGVNTRAVVAREVPTGVALIVVSATGENSIVVTPGANATLAPADLDAHLDLILSASLVLTQLEIPIATVEHLAGICTRAHIPLILDPAPAQPLPAPLLRQIAWLTPNETEAAFYAGSDRTLSETAATLKGLGCENVVLKLGAAGAFVASHDETPFTLEPFPVQALDTTAAGDAFNGGFAVALALGKSPRESAVFASAVAALSVTRRGAQSSMPTRADVNALLASAAGQKRF